MTCFSKISRKCHFFGFSHFLAWLFTKQIFAEWMIQLPALCTFPIFTGYIIQCRIISFEAYVSTGFSIFTKLWNCHHHLIPEHFHHYSSLTGASHSSLALLPLAKHHPTVSLYRFAFLDISHKWKHTTYGFLQLTFFT